MRWVHFIDTSVMVNLLDLPGKNQQHAETLAELERLVERGDFLILPVATVIETGNHIARLPRQRREFAQRFAGYLVETAQGVAPWQFGPNFDAELLKEVARLFPDLATRQIGGGDTSIRAAFATYVESTPNVSVRVWTYDADLRNCVKERPEIGQR